jgi:hypothetical protein
MRVRFAALLVFTGLLSLGACAPSSNAPDAGSLRQSGEPGSAQRNTSGPESRDRERGDGATERDPNAEAAPVFSVTTFDGETFSLSEQRGAPVVLNFWESW